MKNKNQKRRRMRTVILGAEAACLAVLCVLLVVFVVSPGADGESGPEVQTEAETDSSRHFFHSDNSGKKKKIENPTEEDVEEYWENSVFFGDSIMMAYGTFLGGEAEGALSSPCVVARVGYDLETALMPAGEAEHPLYKGEEHTIFEVLPLENPEKVVLSFGINDLGRNSVPQIVENYDTVIQKIWELCPEAEIYVVSCTEVYAAREGGNRTNENVRRLNEMMKEYCTENEVGFIDVASYMAADDGSLYSGYTIDFYVHLNDAAYRTWLQVFRRYAYEALSDKEAPEEMYPITRPDPVEQPVYIPSYVPTLPPESSEMEIVPSETETPAVSTAPTAGSNTPPAENTTPSETTPATEPTTAGTTAPSVPAEPETPPASQPNGAQGENPAADQADAA